MVAGKEKKGGEFSPSLSRSALPTAERGVVLCSLSLALFLRFSFFRRRRRRRRRRRAPLTWFQCDRQTLDSGAAQPYSRLAQCQSSRRSSIAVAAAKAARSLAAASSPPASAAPPPGLSSSSFLAAEAEAEAEAPESLAASDASRNSPSVLPRWLPSRAAPPAGCSPGESPGYYGYSRQPRAANPKGVPFRRGRSAGPRPGR